MDKQTKFTTQEEEMIIDFVKSNELIYNIEHKDYRQSEMKNRLWNELAQKIGKDVDSCIKKWSNIREFYKKCKNHNKFGAGSTTKGKIRLQHLSFLDGVAVNIRDKTVLINKTRTDHTAAPYVNNEEVTQFDAMHYLAGFDVPEMNATTPFQYNGMPLGSQQAPNSGNTLRKRRQSYTLENPFDFDLSDSSVSVPSPSPVVRSSPGTSKHRRSNCSSGKCAPEHSSDVAYDLDEHTESSQSLVVQRPYLNESTMTPLQNLFLSFADMVASFPENIQIETKQKIFQIITDQELNLSLEKQQVDVEEDEDEVEIKRSHLTRSRRKVDVVVEVDPLATLLL